MMTINELKHHLVETQQKISLYKTKLQVLENKKQELEFEIQRLNEA